MSRAARVTAILADTDFRETVTALEGQLTRKVMGRSTPEGDRIEALHQYHALQTVLSALRSVASEKDETST
jgi:hypothetical protein